MPTSITVGMDPVFATKYGRWHLYLSFSYLFVCFFLICVIADQYSSALGNGLSSLAYECTTFRPVVSIPFWVYSVYAVTCYLFVYLLIIALCGRCEWHYISENVLQQIWRHCLGYDSSNRETVSWHQARFKGYPSLCGYVGSHGVVDSEKTGISDFESNILCLNSYMLGSGLRVSRPSKFVFALGPEMS